MTDVTRGAGDLTEIADWVEGRLPEPAAAAVAARVATDPALRADAAFVASVRGAGADLPLVEPPALVRQRLRQQYRGWVARQQPRTASVLELVATLVLDSRHQRLDLATRRLPRGRADGDVVHLVWRTDRAEVVVDVRPDGDGHVRLDGQVLLVHESTETVFEAEVTGPETHRVALDGDVFGRFRIRVPRESSLLRVTNGELAILAELDLVGTSPP